MAKFRISLITNNSETIITDFDSSTPKTLGALSFDEEVTYEQNGANTLSFKMSKYLIINHERIENPLAFTITHGSKIRLLDKNEDAYDFYVNKIDYQIQQSNIIISYDTQSAFSYELSKRNLGYTITSDVQDESYVGALTLDNWAAKIIEDCKITWNYTPVDTRNEEVFIFDYTQGSFNTQQSFSVSNSNAYNALLELANVYGMYLSVSDGDRSFAFIPQKSPIFKGIFVNPTSNLQSLSVSTNSQAMATILNVTGGTDIDENLITLIPSIPGRILDWFHTIGDGSWVETGYTLSLYSDYLESLGGTLTPEEETFIAQINYVPWLENRLINIEYLKDNPFISENQYNDLEDRIYNQLRICNGQLIYLANAYEINRQATNDKINNFENNLTTIMSAAFESGLDNYISDLVADEGMEDPLSKYFTDFVENYDKTSSSVIGSIIKNEEWITKYTNLYDNAEQRFLKNLYLFRTYWGSPYKGSPTVTIGSYFCVNSWNTIDADIIIECAAIEQKLSGYWDIVISSGKWSNYWLPDQWNCLTSLFDIDSGEYIGNTRARWFAINATGSGTNPSTYTYSLNVNLVPTPTLITVAGITPPYTVIPKVIWQYAISIPSDSWVAYSSALSSHIYAHTVLENGVAVVHNDYIHFNDKMIIDTTPENWFFNIESEDINNPTEYYIINDSETLCGYLSVYNAVYPTHDLSPNLFGIYLSILNYIKPAGTISIDNYLAKIEAQKTIWTDLYDDYPSLFLEGNYENQDATTSQILYRGAQIKFKELTAPEPQYNITAIDLLNVRNINLYELSIGDQIRIQDDIIQDSIDQLKKLLQEKLFISAIAYTLRSDSDIKLTVNPVRYNDVLLSRLVKLLV